MNDREDIPEQLSAYLDGELSAEEAQRVEAALAEDAALAAELEQLRRTRRLLQSLPRQAAGEDFARRVLEALPPTGWERDVQTWKPASLPRTWQRILSAAALVVLAIGGGVFVAVELYDAGPPPREELAARYPEENESVPPPLGPLARDRETLTREGEKKDATVPTRSLAGKAGRETPVLPVGSPLAAAPAADTQKKSLRAALSPAAEEEPIAEEVIPAGDLSAAQQEVEVVLQANAVVIAREEPAGFAAERKERLPVAPARAPASKEEVQYLVRGRADQIRNVRLQLAYLRSRSAPDRRAATTQPCDIKGDSPTSAAAFPPAPLQTTPAPFQTLRITLRRQAAKK